MKKMIITTLTLIIVTALALYIPKKGMYRDISRTIDNIETGSIYGFTGDTRHAGDYSVTRLGKLIIVKIDGPASSERYEFLRLQISAFYALNKRVHDVYINEAGTIVVDCRPRF